MEDQFSSGEVLEPIRPQEGPQTRAMECGADILIYGGQAGGGKTHFLIMDQAQWAHVPGYTGMVFRRESTQLTGPGSLVEAASEIFPRVGGNMRMSAPQICRFPNNGLVGFRHLQYEKDKESHQGKAYAVISFDELTHFTETQFWYLVTRNRSTCAVESYVRCTCNPDADSWVRDFVDWWVGPDGFILPERDGVLRWMIRGENDEGDDEILWADSPEELPVVQFKGEVVKPLSVTFIEAKLEDNPALMKSDPGYAARIANQPKVERERLGLGNWNVSDQRGAEWGNEYFQDIWAERWPSEFDLSVLAVDASESGDGDDCGIVFVGLSGGKLYVDADIEPRPASDVVPATAKMATAHLAGEIVFEKVGFQTLLKPEMERYLAATVMPVAPVGLIEHHGVKKIVRIKRLGGYLLGGRIKLKKNRAGCKTLLRQLKKTGVKGFHDDGPDALEMAIRRLNMIARSEMQSNTREEQLVP